MSLETNQPVTYLELLPPSREQDLIEVAAAELALTGLDLYITTTCDRRCNHCFLTDQWLNSRQSMDTEMVADIADWATGSNSTLTEFTLLGGEASRHPNFAEIVQIIHDSGLETRVVTNGSPAFRNALEAKPKLAEQLTRTALSIDAPDQRAHDKIRGRGTFGWVLATAAALRERDMPFDINTTVLRDNVAKVPQMIDLAEELGAQRLNIHWYSLAGRGRIHAADQVPTPEEWRKVLEIVIGRTAHTSMTIDCELGYAYALPGEDTSMCKVRERSNLQISPDGTALVCGMLAESPEKSGYIWRQGMLFKRGAETDELALTKNTKCSGCPLREPANGQTPLCIYNRLAV